MEPPRDRGGGDREGGAFYARSLVVGVVDDEEDGEGLRLSAGFGLT